MIRGLIHRCTIWTPQAGNPDAYGQPAPPGFSVSAAAAPCRLSLTDADTPGLLLGLTPVGEGDRVTDITDAAGAGIDSGPFAVIEVRQVNGRSGLAYRRLRLRRLVSIDQT